MGEGEREGGRKGKIGRRRERGGGRRRERERERGEGGRER